jgi:hypothetical protein
MVADSFPSTEDAQLNITLGSIKEPNKHLLHINDTDCPAFTIESYTSVVMLQHFIYTQCSHCSHDTALLVFIMPLLQWTHGNLEHLGGSGQGCIAPHNIKLTITKMLCILRLLDTTWCLHFFRNDLHLLSKWQWAISVSWPNDRSE